MFNRGMDFLKKHIKDNLIIYSIIVLVFLIGLSVGAFTVKIVDKHQKQELFYYLRDFFQLFHTDELSNSSILKQSFINNIQLLIFSWFLGVLVITAPLVLFIIGFKGFVIGFTVGLLIEEFKFLGVLIFIFGVFPQNLVIIPVFIIASVISLSFAISFLRVKLQKIKDTTFSKRLIFYTSLYSSLLILIMVACFIEGYIAPVFIRLITRNII